jgi:hypothetical protein
MCHLYQRAKATMVNPWGARRMDPSGRARMGVLHVMGGIVTGSAFPVRPEQLTVEWLEGLIRAGGELAAGERLVSFEVKPVGEVIGVLGEVVRVFLTYGKPGAGPATLVIKFAHKNAENRQIANNTKMYDREVLFFNEKWRCR